MPKFFLYNANPQESDYTGKFSYISLGSLVLSLLRPYRKWLVIIFLTMLLETAMSLASPWPLKVIIDNVIGDQPLPFWLQWVEEMSIGDNKMALAGIAALSMIIITAIDGLAGFFDNYYTESVAQYIASDLRQRIYHHLQRLSLTYYDSQQVGKLLSTITTDVSTIQDFAASTLLSMVIDAFTIIGMLGLMFYLNWDFTLIVVGVAPFLLLFIVRFRKAVKKATREVRKDQSEMVTVLQNGLESIRTVNAFGRQDKEEERLKKVSLATVDAALKARRIKSLISPVITITISICIAVVLWRGASLVLAGIMTIGSLTVFLSYLNKFFNPLKDLAKMTGNVAQATVALERIKEILDTELVIPEKKDARDPGVLKGDIVFEKVNFSYKSGIPVLHDIDLVIHAGQHVGICGPTGGGKSTIASLIPRFYDIDSGCIMIDGNDIRDYKLEGLRNQIGFVLQDTMLFYGTIRENIAYGKPSATEQEIITAAKLANADEFIQKMPLGYDTMIGERGLTLSGGERQRIGVARAVVRNAPILILDEPTASLDAESEKLVADALRKLMSGRTVITITHRLNTIIDTDKIFVIKNGKIIEEGKHEELMSMGKAYAELFHIMEHSPHIQ
ncbi:ABC transporter ATP-binding protein [Flavihumibacter fluvii]|uniref:ABC transporter ATP-binding protein n=1 Tax=Flavihumibacter fluvii TaxID=2838157 RepID=UPI001BDF5AFE|nr:ABC transporter ATP-binding protein [Flavihumibacter fluvii]ULQ53744.1 ABC transporter ATP-binding protein/permease [Flavihumibacter fluvii]